MVATAADASAQLQLQLPLLQSASTLLALMSLLKSLLQEHRCEISRPLAAVVM